LKALENEMHRQGALKDMYAPAGGARRCRQALLSGAQLQHGSQEVWLSAQANKP